jgi:hypothetical protein
MRSSRQIQLSAKGKGKSRKEQQIREMPSRNGVRDDKEAGMTIQKKTLFRESLKAEASRNLHCKISQPANVPLK